MKKKIRHQYVTILCCILSIAVYAQNADEIIYNSYAASYNFAGASFVIDTGSSTSTVDRAFLIWAANVKPDSLRRYLSLSEYGTAGQYLSERASAAHKNGSLKTLFPKKMIKSKFSHAYYLLGYVIKSNHPIPGSTITTYSLPVVYKIRGSDLGLIWSSRLHFAAVNSNNNNQVIEYNDIIEDRNGNIEIVGKTSSATNTKEYILATKLFGATGAISWNWYYNGNIPCNEGANSIAQLSDGSFGITGYVRKCTSPSVTGAADVFYLHINAGGIPVAGQYRRYIWPAGQTMWGDKITRYTAVTGADRLIISGYVDISTTAGAPDRQILVLNIQQNGNAISYHHIGDAKTDVANDLIFNQIGSNDYYLYLTGFTANYASTTQPRNEVYFMQLKFNSATGVTGLVEFSIFPVTLAPYDTYTGRTGFEVKNAGDYRRFAILATGAYRPAATGSQTYTNVLVRDFGDVTGNCIKQYQPPVKSFVAEGTYGTYAYINPNYKVYKEGWIKLGRLTVRQLCQQVKIDPTKATLAPVSSAVAESITVSKTMQQLSVSPNPAKSQVNLLFEGKAGPATVYIFNASMQPVKTFAINAAGKNSIAIQVHDLLPGIYFVQVKQQSQVSTAKFMKE